MPERISLTLPDIAANYRGYAMGAGRPMFDAVADPTIATRLQIAALAGSALLGSLELEHVR